MFATDPTHGRRFGAGNAPAPAVGGRATLLAGTGLLAVTALVVARRRVRRVVVAGASMEPTLREGDRLLVVAGLRPRIGAVVAVRDPRGQSPTGTTMVKRIAAVGPGGLDVRGDAPGQSTDSRTFGPVPTELVEGTVIWRYAPGERAGRIAPRPATTQG